MKRSVFSTTMVIFVLLLFASTAVSMNHGMTKSMTGKVIGVDENGKGIAISSKAGGQEIVAGAIVTDATVVHVKGKKANIMDIKAGDTVTLTYSYENNDLYAKKVVKR
ncbi:MAG TPA: hypothetical protein PKN85_05885 [Syntrophorhabdaceae bacterium]|nr:hypothetical protein [Syntrophorhabdaceae bacterium]HOD75972.1 hypothetical protein [Syntrophorhabdaceae bacterium]